MRNYWSCSKFANWIRGTPKPVVEDSAGWNAWEKLAQAAHPVRYWIAEEGLDYIQSFFSWIPNRINDLRYYLNNRYTVRTHALTSRLPRGQWHEYDTRLLHSAFDSFVDFVEIEKAWMAVVWSEEGRKQFKTPWWRNHWWARWFVQWRCPEAGISYLEWEMSLVQDEQWGGKDNPNNGRPTPQAIAAREQWELYYWWKHVRPRRVEPMDYSGWTAYCDERRDEGFMACLESRNEADAARSRRILDLCHQLEANYEAEDEEMLIRLIRIRNSLWT